MSPLILSVSDCCPCIYESTIFLGIPLDSSSAYVSADNSPFSIYSSLIASKFKPTLSTASFASSVGVDSVSSTGVSSCLDLVNCFSSSP